MPADQAGAASAISETAYELGAVLGTAVLGGILTATYSARVGVPAGLSPAQAASATETVGGATAFAPSLPAARSADLLASARHAFESGMRITSLIAVAVAVTIAAAGMVLATLRDAR